MDEDKLSKLQSQYQEQFDQTASPNEAAAESGTINHSTSESFFDRYNKPPEVASNPTHHSPASQVNDYMGLPNDTATLTSKPSKSSRGNKRRQATRNINSNQAAPKRIPWRAIIFIAAAIILIFLMKAIWDARYTILNSVIDFVWALLPLVLMIAGLIWIYKKLFFGK